MHKLHVVGTQVGRMRPDIEHLVFAVGALPLILAAMSYFVPVLTRSGKTPRLLAGIPLAAVIAGTGIVGFFVHGTPALRFAAPWIALVAVALFAFWLALRWHRCLGHANPCIAWYAAALGLLALGLIAVAVAPYWPERAHALRVFHIHINTLGFIGVTALGTMQVLLPTIAGQIDTGATERLTRDLKWSAGGAFILALGVTLAPPLAVIGAVAYAWPPLRLIGHVWRNWRTGILSAGSTLPLLVAGLTGLCFVLVQGGLHTFDITTGAAAIPLFIIAFLLPLVSGAAGHLLPVWLLPGIRNAWHTESRRRLAYGARARGVLLLTGGVMAALGLAGGYALGVFGALWLVGSMMLAVAFKRPAR